MKGQDAQLWKAGAIVGLVFGAILAFDGWRDNRVLALGSPTPQSIRLDDLAARGPGANIHVTVTDFAFAAQYLIEEKGGKWNRVWIPMLPVGEEPARKIRVLVRSFRIANRAELEAFYHSRQVTGIITNAVDGRIGQRESQLLKRTYSDLDPQEVLLLYEGRAFPRRTGVNLRFLGAALLLGAGTFSARRLWETR